MACTICKTYWGLNNNNPLYRVETTMTTAIVFPGQGSQSVGMMTEFYEQYDYVKDVYNRASKVLGYDLWALIKDGPVEKLNQTEFTQPAVLASGYAAYLVWIEQTSIKPEVVAGHSLGEYTALVATDAMSLEDGIKLVSERAKLMQQAVPEGEGAMAAILGLEDDVLVKLCEQAEGVVEAVNFNSAGQVVIAGEKQAVANAIALADEAGAKKCIALPVSVPSHSSLMKGAAEKLATTLDAVELSMPNAKVLQNVTGESVSDVAQMKALLKQQLYSPVLWVKTMENIIESGVDNVIEVGPGKVLTGLAKRINRRFPSFNVGDNASLEKTIDKVLA